MVFSHNVQLQTNSSKVTEEPNKLDAPTIAERDSLQKRESGVSENSPMRLRMEQFIKDQQKEIVSELEKIDGKKFRIDEWSREHGGGGSQASYKTEMSLKKQV